MVSKTKRLEDLRILNDNYQKYYTSIYEKLKQQKKDQKKNKKLIKGSKIHSEFDKGKDHTLIYDCTQDYIYRSLTVPGACAVFRVQRHTTDCNQVSVNHNDSESISLKKRAKNYLKSKLELARPSSPVSISTSNCSHFSWGDGNNNGGGGIFNINFSFGKNSKFFSTVEYKQIGDLPLELITNIYFFLMNDKKSLIRGLYVNKHFSNGCKPILYKNITLVSTYRLAQLVTTLQHNPDLRNYVESLDLSNLKSGMELYQQQKEEQAEIRNKSSARGRVNTALIIDNENDDYIQEEMFASWRDWRFRDDLLYSPTRMKRHRTMSTSNLQLSEIKSSLVSEQSKDSMYFTNRNKHKGTLFSLNKKSKDILKSMNFLKISFVCGHEESPFVASVKNKSQVVNKSKKQIKIDKAKLNGSSNMVKFKIDNDPIPKIKHPTSNRFLSKYCMNKDIPMGQLLHLLDFCGENLKYLDLSSLSLSDDFIIDPIVYNLSNNQKKGKKLNERLDGQKKLIHTEKLQIKEWDQKIKGLERSPVFYSDTSLHYLNIEDNIGVKKLSIQDVFKKLSKLPKIKVLGMQNCIFINENIARELLFSHWAIKNINNGVDYPTYNLAGSGMVHLKWALNGELKDVLIMMLLSQLNDNTEDLQIESLFHIRTHIPLFQSIDEQYSSVTDLIAKSKSIFLKHDSKRQISFKVYIYDNSTEQKYESYRFDPISCTDHQDRYVFKIHFYLNNLQSTAVYLPILQDTNMNIKSHIIYNIKKLYLQRIKYLRMLKLRDNIGYNMIQFPSSYSYHY